MQPRRYDPDDRPGVPTGLLEPADPHERERLLMEAEAEIDAGRGVPGDVVSRWLHDLAAGRPAKVPCDR